MICETTPLARIDLRKAIDNGAICLKFQPQIDAISRKIVGFEGVAQWQHPHLGDLPPSIFQSLAQREGLSTALSRAHIADAARAANMWSAHGYRIDIGVQVSRADMLDPDFGDDIVDIVSTQGAQPDWLVLEVEEHAIAQGEDAAFAGLERLSGLGFNIALDAKGPPIIALDKRARALFAQIKCMATTMLSVAGPLHTIGASRLMRRLDAARAAGLETVASGCETHADMEACADLGFTRLQGKIVSPPLGARGVKSKADFCENYALN